jgi:LPS-assembly lipoprotein
MSSFDHSRSGRSRNSGRLILLAAVATVALAACTVQPLYAPTAAGTSVVAAIGDVYIEPVDDRVGQEVRNKLIFDLTGGSGQPASARYRMKLVVTSSESALGVTPIETAPAYAITVAATYEVRSVADDKIVLRSTSRQSASYDRVNQVYANTRAKLDAENRAAALVADDIRIRLAAAATRGTI